MTACLNDINGLPREAEEHVRAALDGATDRPGARRRGRRRHRHDLPMSSRAAPAPPRAEVTATIPWAFWCRPTTASATG
ncbi:MAG: hypothetical protein V9G11_05570 [Bifidobacterium adolescentis]